MDWLFKGIDAISGPARAMAGSLRAFQGEVQAADRALRKLTADERRAASASRAVDRVRGESIASMGTFAAGVLAAGAAVGAGAFALGRNVVELAAFQQSAETTLTATMGDATQAAQAYREAITIANRTPLDTREVVTAMNSLAAAGFRTLDTMRPMLGILTDVGALHGADAMSRFSLALGQVQARGALTMEELNQLREAAPSIAQPLMAALGSQLGFSGPNMGRQVQAAISARRVTAQMVNDALGAAGVEMNRATGGNLGGIARAQSQTLLGSISNASNAWDNLILSMGTGSNALANGPGLTAFRGFIDSVTQSLDVSTERGGRAMAILRPLIDGVFGALFQGAPGGSVIDSVLVAVREATPAIVSLARGVRGFVEGFGGGFMGAVQPAIEMIQQLSSEGETGGDTLRNVGQAVGFLAGAFVLGVGVLSTAVSGITMIFTELPSTLRLVWNDVVGWFTTVPGALIDGFLTAMRERWAGMITEVTGLAAQLPESVRSVLGIHSPSRVFAEIGWNTAAGMTEGITAGTGDVERAVAGMVSAPSAEGGAGARGGGAMVNVQATIIVDGRGRTDEEIGQDFRAQLTDLLADELELLAFSLG